MSLLRISNFDAMKKLEPRVRAICNELIDEFIADGKCDAAERYTKHIPVRAIAHMLGIPEKEMAIDWNTVIFNMLTIKGIYGREMYETWYKMTVMLQSGLNLKPVITHRFHFTEFQQGFDAMLSGNCGKVVLDWSA